MTLHQLRCFLEVAKCKSFVNAAKSLYTTQPVITYNISSLEKELDVVLFNRDKRKVELTEAGEAFFEDMSKLMTFYDDAVNRVKEIGQGKRTTLTIGIRRFGDYSAISQTIRKYNETSTNCVASVVAQSQYQPLDYLFTGKTDISYIYEHEYTDQENITFIPLRKMKYYALVSRDNPLSQKEELSLDDFCGQHVIIPEDDYLQSVSVPSIFELSEHGAILDHKVSSHEEGLVLSFANLGIYIIISLPETNIPEMAKIPLKDTNDVVLGLAYLKMKENDDLKQFIQLAKQVYSKH